MNRKLIALSGLFATLPMAEAHHAAHAFYGGPMVLVEGTLTGSRLMNPHSYFRVAMDDGTEWVFETAPSGSMIRNDGMTEEDFAGGRRVAMSGDSNREGRRVARVRSVAFPGESGDDDFELYFLGARLPDEAPVQDIGRSSPRCWDWNDTSLVKCFRVTMEIRSQIDARYGDEHLLW